MKVGELKGAELDYWVAKSQEWPTWSVNGKTPLNLNRKLGLIYRPSESWSECGPLIEKFNVWLSDDCNVVADVYYASTPPHIGHLIQEAGDQKTAICRAVVASVYGEEVPCMADTQGDAE